MVLYGIVWYSIASYSTITHIVMVSVCTTHLHTYSDDGPGIELQTSDGVLFTMSYKTAEPKGYLSGRQSTNGDNIIHVISSRQYYTFNLSWLMAKPGCPPSPL